MLLRTADLERIADGTVTLAFRRWSRPTVKAGGALLTARGQLEIVAVDPVDPNRIGPEEARAAGFASRADLLRKLDERQGPVYRVRFGRLLPDPRIALRERIPDEPEMTRILDRLRRSDGRSSTGAWTRKALELIRDRPAVRAGDLASTAGLARADFKIRVRRLKEMGLTESLRVGYRLSPRGESVLERMTREGHDG